MAERSAAIEILGRTGDPGAWAVRLAALEDEWRGMEPELLRMVSSPAPQAASLGAG